MSAVSLAATGAAGGSDPIIQRVTTSREFFDPTIGQSVAISFSLAAAGTVDVFVVGPGGAVVRRLADAQQLGVGTQTLTWDGRSDVGTPVPNDAYALRIRWAAGERKETFDPGHTSGKLLDLKSPSYDVSGGAFLYELPSTSRVFLRATCLSPKPTSAYAKTIVSGEARVAGPVVEVWNGFDESGKVFMPERPGFQVTLEVRELPTPTIITIGNRSAPPQASLRTDPSITVSASVLP